MKVDSWHSRAEGSSPSRYQRSSEPPAGSYVRIRESGGTVYFEHTTNPRGSWTTFYADAGASWLDQISRVTIGVYSSAGFVTSPAVFDNLNRCPR